MASPGFPGNKAKVVGLQALSKLIEYVYHHGVGVAVFEDLGRIKCREFTASPTANRKMSRYAKRQLLTHAVIKSLRYGLKPVLVDPRNLQLAGAPLHGEARPRQAHSISIPHSTQTPPNEKTMNNRKAHKQPE